MDCNISKFAQKKQTKANLLDAVIEQLNIVLGLKKGTIHAYHAYGGVLLATGTNNILYGVDRTTDGKMIDVVEQCISVIEFGIKPFNSIHEMMK